MNVVQQEEKSSEIINYIEYVDKFITPTVVRFSQICNCLYCTYDLVIVSPYHDRTTRIYKDMTNKEAQRLIDDGYGSEPVMAIYNNTMEENNNDRLVVFLLDVYSGFLD